VTFTPELELIGHDLDIAVRHLIATRKRRRRTIRATGAALTLGAIFCAAALASGIGGDLQLNPTKWSILGGGSVDGGRGAYVHAKRTADGSNSTFLVEHDAGLPAYRAFLLHEETLAAAQATSPVPVRVEPGALCTPAALRRAETVAMATLQAQFPPGTDADMTKSSVDSAVAAAFAGAPCKGLEYAGEQARLVYGGTQPASKLMPGVG
jgi:hypothetical protein